MRILLLSLLLSLMACASKEPVTEAPRVVLVKKTLAVDKIKSVADIKRVFKLLKLSWSHPDGDAKGAKELEAVKDLLE